MLIIIIIIIFIQEAPLTNVVFREVQKKKKLIYILYKLPKLKTDGARSVHFHLTFRAIKVTQFFNKLKMEITGNQKSTWPEFIPTSFINTG